jgi:hypothetical protein
VILKSLPYSKFDEKGSTDISDLVNIEEPVVTSGGPITSVAIGTDYKYLEFSYPQRMYYEYNADPNNWDEANTLAISKGGRIPTAQELIDWLAINGRIFTGNMWAPVYNYSIASPYKDWVQVGLADGTNGTPAFGVATGRLLSAFASPDKVSTDGSGTNVYNDYYFWTFDLLYDFTRFNTLATWKAYADSLGMTYELNYGPDWPGSYSNDVWLYTDGNVSNGGDYGWIQFQLPVGYDTVIINWGKGPAGGSGTVKLYIDNIERDSITGSPATKIFTTNTSQYYVAGQYVKIQEDVSTMNKNLKVIFSNSQKSYTVNFPTEATECSALIIGNPNYTYIPSLTLFGTYNILVGNTSTITKNDNSFTQNNSQTTQSLPFTNTQITGSSITYTSPTVIIKYKLTKGSSYTGKSQGILKYLPTPSTTSTTPSNTGSWTIEECANTTFKSDFLNRLTALSPSTSITQENGNNYTTDFLFDPDTKFTDKADWGRQYKYNLCLSVESTNTSDKQKYCVAFVFFNNKSGTPVFQHTIISSNRNADWTISDYTHPTTNKKYVKITVKTVNTINTLNIKI